MFQARENEPDYAKLDDPTSQLCNRYGLEIDKASPGDPLFGQSLNINEDDRVGENPNRYKQHGFYFNADNCIACHACEAACSEKNNNPAHLAFRSVGYVEGGSYPATQRINISMACNHCDNPVCLKGCPTRAYTKFAEYGAVLQDPDICFGCGYCTWVCPYNAPQLDPVEGQVTKCNMCVDRLEVGLKPACVSACLGKALDFGVVENVPQGRVQAKASIPGFPRNDITHPNIRFQQTRTTQRDMRRLDSMPLKYHREDVLNHSQGETEEEFRPSLDPKHGHKRSWGLRKLLGSHENAHVAFTLASQAVIGAFTMVTLGRWFNLPVAVPENLMVPMLLLLLTLMGVGMFKLNMHLGKPHRFYRGFYNLKLSPVSREIAGISLFFGGLAGFTLLAAVESLFGVLFPPFLKELFVVVSLCGGAVGGYYMYRLYRIPARPYWDHWQTAASFMGSALSLGSLLLMLLLVLNTDFSTNSGEIFVLIAVAGLVLEGVGLLFHHRDLVHSESEGAASIYEQSTTYGYTYWLRNGLLLLALSLLLLTVLIELFLPVWILLLASMILISGILGRALFYNVVIPTTMPGAFFWKNRGFTEHALESGLYRMPQLGVEPPRHHPFKLQELIQTARSML